MSYRLKKQWRCVGQDGDVFHRDTKRGADRENHFGAPSEVWAICDRHVVIADCYSPEDGRRVLAALRKAAA